MSEFKHLNLYERQRIERYRKEKRSRRFIAGKLDRSVSSISDEINGNSVWGRYSAKKAHFKAYQRRWRSKIQCMKVAMDPLLKKFVIDSITNENQSPEGISGRLKNIEQNIQYASTKAIYNFVKSPNGRQIEGYLYSKAVHRKSGKKRGTLITIDGRITIDKRPKRALKRKEFGHYEGDFIESGKDGKGSLLVLVERKTRYPFLRYLEDRSNAKSRRSFRRWSMRQSFSATRNLPMRKVRSRTGTKPYEDMSKRNPTSLLFQKSIFWKSKESFGTDLWSV